MGLLDPVNPLGEIAVDVLACGRAASRRCPPRKTLRTAGRSPFTVVVDRVDDVRFTRTVPAAPAHGGVDDDPSRRRMVGGQ
ncbi:hypothetical protein ABZ504_54825, partial [Streptomyces mirabilis]|uniref:hypothetical protein n=1 Tax=Streptomyces mirabilis TaxID=68239 RepID=UPI0033EA2BF1